jgi:hypothetical protein
MTQGGKLVQTRTSQFILWVGNTYIRYVTVKVIEYDTIRVGSGWFGLGDNSL